MLSQSEKQRYQRQTSLEGFGTEAQQKLKNASVLVIGAGALGCPALNYLAAAGIGHIGIADGDSVSLSNLHRQVLYTTADIGRKKAEVARERLLAINPEISVTVFEEFLDKENVKRLFSPFDIIVDGTDNFPTRYLINDACVLWKKVNVHGSVIRFTGTVSVFNYQDGPNYRDLFPVPPTPEEAPSCAEAGVIGIIPSVIGSLQAMEVLKVVTGIGAPLAGKLLRYDLLTSKQQLLHFEKDPGNVLNTADESFIFGTDYHTFCHIKQETMKTINVQELKELKDTNADFQLIDVREPYENEICTLDGLLIPMGEVPDNVDKIDKDRQVIVHCRSGKRSATIIDFLEQNHGYTNLYNLEGGILAWAAEIDPEMESY